MPILEPCGPPQFVDESMPPVVEYRSVSRAVQPCAQVLRHLDLRGAALIERQLTDGVAAAVGIDRGAKPAVSEVVALARVRHQLAARGAVEGVREAGDVGLA